MKVRKLREFDYDVDKWFNQFLPMSGRTINDGLNVLVAETLINGVTYKEGELYADNESCTSPSKALRLTRKAVSAIAKRARVMYVRIAPEYHSHGEGGYYRCRIAYRTQEEIDRTPAEALAIAHEKTMEDVGELMIDGGFYDVGIVQTNKDFDYYKKAYVLAKKDTEIVNKVLDKYAKDNKELVDINEQLRVKNINLDIAINAFIREISDINTEAEEVADDTI